MRINTLSLYCACTVRCTVRILFTLACIPSSMNPKRTASLLPSTPRFKRQRKAVTLKVKLDIIKRHERGEGTTEIGRAHVNRCIDCTFDRSKFGKGQADLITRWKCRRGCKTQAASCLRLWKPTSAKGLLPQATTSRNMAVKYKGLDDWGIDPRLRDQLLLQSCWEVLKGEQHWQQIFAACRQCSCPSAHPQHMEDWWWWSYGSLAAGVAIISWSATVSLMQCPSTSTHAGTGTHFADLGRMTGWVNPLVY